MGLIRAALSATGSTLADQWKEFFYCDAIPNDILVVKGRKRTKGNNRGSDNLITNGSGIAVADGQCAIIVEQGRVVEICAVPGEYTYDMSSEPSIFSGSLGEGIKQTFATIGKRFTYGGDTAKDQRVYYFNTKEIRDNKFGTPNSVPFRVVDAKIGLDIDITVRCNGMYSYQIDDPILFYTNVCSNVSDVFRRSEIDGMLKSEFLNALQPAFARISEQGIRYSALPGHTMELCDAMNAILTKKWTELRGLKVVSVAINSITAPKEDEELIKQAQRTAMMRDPNMAAATLVGAQADAMKAAASNSAGAMAGFMGMNLAQQNGGMNAQSLFTMGQQQTTAQPQTAEQPAKSAWQCSCGTMAAGKFCPECGAPKPANEGWTCSCGVVNQGKFCSECGKKKPEAAPLYRCDKCGWKPEDPIHPPKFCPECGDAFDENDRV